MYKQTIASDLIDVLKKHNKTISTAESLTGGLVSKLITDVSGVSKVFKGGICSYTNEIKHHILDINSKVIEEFGAVSEETALEMSNHIRKIMSTDIGISTTGVAGPGKSEGHEVGLVYISVASEERTIVKKLNFSSKLTREEIRNKTAEEIMKLAIEFVNKMDKKNT